MTWEDLDDISDLFSETVLDFGYRQCGKPYAFIPEPEDLGSEFLKASEARREEMRRDLATAHIRPEVSEIRIPKKEKAYRPRGRPVRSQKPLSADDIRKIRSLAPHIAGRELARKYRVSHTTIQRVLKGAS